MSDVSTDVRPATNALDETSSLRRALPDASAARALTTAEANKFLNRAPGFLEKRRSSGIDCPPYIQTRPKGAVRYLVEDLLAWEQAKMRQNTSYDD